MTSGDEDKALAATVAALNLADLATADIEAMKRSAREEQIAELGRSVVLDFKYFQKSILALFTMIDEIWSRISVCTSHDGDGAFTRLSYLPCVASDEIEVGDRLTLWARMAQSVKHFGKPPAVPSKLTSFIPHDAIEENSLIPDYNKYFRKLLCFHDDVQLHLLDVFKEHLEDLLVYLGRIDEWVIESVSTYEFLKETFGEEREIGPGRDNEGVVQPVKKEFDARVGRYECITSSTAFTGANAYAHAASTGANVSNAIVYDAFERAMANANAIVYDAAENAMANARSHGRTGRSRLHYCFVLLKSFPQSAASCKASIDIDDDKGKEKIRQYLKFLDLFEDDE